MESTAEWAQREAVPTDRTYSNPIRTYLLDINQWSGPWRHIDSRPEEPEQGDDFAYSPLFPYYLAERLGSGNDIIKTAWEQYRDHGNCSSFVSVLQNNVLPQNQKIEQLFPDFAEANYFLDYASPDVGELRSIVGNNFVPSADQPSLITDQNLAISGPPTTYRGRTVQKMGTGYVQIRKNFTNPNLGRKLDINIDLSVFNPSTPPVVKIWMVNQVAPPVRATTIVPAVQLIQDVFLTKRYRAETVIQNFDDSQLQWVVIEIVNPQPNGANLEWSYTANVIAPTPTPTNTLVPTATSTPMPTSTPTFTPTFLPVP